MDASSFQLALITGATSGIGEALADLLAEKKIPLLLTGRNREHLDRLRVKLSPSVPVETVAADLGQASEIVQLKRKIRERCPDLVVNNAGFGLYGHAILYPIEEQLQMVEVDVKAVLELTLEAAKALTDAKKCGVILNVSSAAAFQIMPYFSTYAASKAFVNSLSRSLDYELKEKGVRVLVSCPGQVDTGFSSRASGHAYSNKGNKLVMSSRFAAECLWEQIKKRKPLMIFDWRYRLMTFFSRLLPVSWIAPVLKRIIALRR